MKMYSSVKIIGVFTLIQALLYTGINLYLTAHILSLLTPPGWIEGYLPPHTWKTIFASNLRCTQSVVFEPSVTLNSSHYIWPSQSLLDSTASLYYQLTYTAMHVCWIFFSIGLIIGSSHKIWQLLLPWMILTPMIILFDLFVSTMYIIAIVHSMKTGVDDNLTSYILMVLFYSRAGLVWLINIVLFGITVRACVKLQNEGFRMGSYNSQELFYQSIHKDGNRPHSIRRRPASDLSTVPPQHNRRTATASEAGYNNPISKPLLDNYHTEAPGAFLPSHRVDTIRNGSLRKPSLPLTPNYFNSGYSTMDKDRSNSYNRIRSGQYSNNSTLRMGDRASFHPTLINYSNESIYTEPYDSTENITSIRRSGLYNK